MEILGDMMIPTQSINASNDSDSSSEDEDYVDHEEDDEDDKLEPDNYRSKIEGNEEETIKVFGRALNRENTTEGQELIMGVLEI